ncbi:hypothetical protein chiPu_0024330, partial [Chiloscyllium punctatum]|nr:hypothetical protein [Chiloscyllium punctatum]
MLIKCVVGVSGVSVPSLCAGIILDLMHLRKPGGFDTSLFYRDIVSVTEDEDGAAQGRESAKLDDLLRKVWARDYKKKATT